MPILIYNCEITITPANTGNFVLKFTNVECSHNHIAVYSLLWHVFKLFLQIL